MPAQDSDETRPDPVASSPDGGASLVSGFVVDRELGRGGFGTVYLARDRALGRDVALKVLRCSDDSAQRRRFLAEARLLAAVDHPNIVRIHSITETAGELELALELIDGATLKELVLRDGPLGAEEATRIGADLCRALATLHARGILHRDVKPANVMRAKGGRIVLLDFGLARSAEFDPLSGALAGTPQVMAPEQLLPDGVVDARTDLYALGVTLFWLVTGGYPDDAPLVDRRSDLPPAFAAILTKALAPDPADRFASAGAMERRLRDFLGDVPAPDARTERRRPAAALAIGALLVLSLATSPVRSLLRPAPLELACDLYRVEGAQPALLHEGDAVGAGDRVMVTVAPTRAAYLYVFNEAADGRLDCLYPIESADRPAPLAACAPGQRIELPGAVDGVPQAWVVDGAGATETFLVVASTREESVVDALGLGGREPGAGVRGVVGVAAIDPRISARVHDGRARLEEFVLALTRRRERDGSVAFRRVNLRNGS